MSFSFKIKNPGRVISALVDRNSKFRAEVRKQYILGADKFIQEIRVKYYYARRGDVGLNRITKELYKSIRI